MMRDDLIVSSQRVQIVVTNPERLQEDVPVYCPAAVRAHFRRWCCLCHKWYSLLIHAFLNVYKRWRCPPAQGDSQRYRYSACRREKQLIRLRGRAAPMSFQSGCETLASCGLSTVERYYSASTSKESSISETGKGSRV